MNGLDFSLLRLFELLKHLHFFLLQLLDIFELRLLIVRFLEYFGGFVHFDILRSLFCFFLDSLGHSLSLLGNDACLNFVQLLADHFQLVSLLRIFLRLQTDLTSPFQDLHFGLDGPLDEFVLAENFLGKD